MVYGISIDVPAPIEVYDVAHAEVVRRSGLVVDGLIFHLGRPTVTGFQIIEIWETVEQSERFNAEVVWPVMAELAQGGPEPAAAPTTEEFEVRGLILPGGVLLP